MAYGSKSGGKGDKPYPSDWERTASIIDSYRAHAESGDYADRQQERIATRQNLKAYYGRIPGVAGGQEQRASANQLWLQFQIQFAKIVNGQDFRPKVSPTRKGEYQDNARAAEATAPVAQHTGRTPTEAAASMRQAALLDEYDNNDLEGHIHELLRMAEWYGDGYVLVTMDQYGRIQYDVLSPDDVWHDPDAKNMQDGRYIGYGTWMPVSEARAMFPAFADKIRGKERTKSEFYDSGSEDAVLYSADDEQENTYLECWYVRDYETTTEMGESLVLTDIDEVAAYEQDGWLVDEDGIEYENVATEGVTGASMVQVPVAWTVYKEIEVPKYPGGWRKIHYCCGAVLDDPDDKESQHSDLEGGIVPMAHLKYFSVPGEAHGMSQARHIRPLAEKLDDMLETAVDISEEMLPMILKKPGKLTIDSANNLGLKTKVRVLEMDPRTGADTPLGDVLMPMPGAEMPISFQNLMGQINGWVDMLGGGNLRGQNNIPRDASEKFVAAIEDADHARVTEVRRHLRNAVEQLYEIINAYLETYQMSPREYGVDTGYKRDNFTYSMRSLAGERDYVISVGGSSNMPHDPIERNNLIKGVVDSLAAVGNKTLALGTLELMDIENKPAIRSLLEQFFNEQAQAAQNAPSVTPDEAKRYKEGAADVLEQLGKDFADSAPQVAIAIAEQLNAAANGEQIDYNKIDQIIHDFRPPVLPGERVEQ